MGCGQLLPAGVGSETPRVFLALGGTASRGTSPERGASVCQWPPTPGNLEVGGATGEPAKEVGRSSERPAAFVTKVVV